MKSAREEPSAHKLRILVFSHYFWPESFRINQLVEDLILAGADVTVLAGYPSYPEGRIYGGYSAWRTLRERHPSGYEIVRVPVMPRGNGGAVALTLNYLSFLVSGLVFGTWLLRGRRFDILFNFCSTPPIQGFIGVWLRYLNGGKLVLWVQDLWPEALSSTGFVKSPALLRLVGKVVSLLYRSADLILGQSHAFVRFIKQTADGTPVRFFPNPGEHPPKEQADSGLRLPGKFNVVFAGNLGKAQSMEAVVAAAELLQDDPDIHFTLVGSGSMMEWISRRIEERQITNLTLPGRVVPAAMPAIYAQASALLLTLVDDPLLAQTVPSKLQSYLATGVPIVVAVNGEAAEIIAESQGGMSCPADNPAALAGALRRLKAMPQEERRAMGEAGRKFFDAHYQPERLARELLDILRAASQSSMRIRER